MESLETTFASLDPAAQAAVRQKQQASKAKKAQSKAESASGYSQANALAAAEDSRIVDLEAFVPLQSGRDFSRLLYASPVCFLTSRRPQKDGHNVMTISWLSCINNEGRVMLSMNKRRFSAECVEADPEFVLSIPCGGMEDLVLMVGKYSGRRGDKFSLIDGLRKMPVSANTSDGKFLSSKPPRNKFSALEMSSSDEEGGGDDREVSLEGSTAPVAWLPPVAVEGTVAWLRLKVLRVLDGDALHNLIIANVEEASVKRGYWNGKCFAPVEGSRLPPLLKFLGSQNFAYAVSPVQKNDAAARKSDGGGESAVQRKKNRAE